MEYGNTLSMHDLTTFREYLTEADKSELTIEKYLHDAAEFITWLSGRELTKIHCNDYLDVLREKGLAISTINGRIAAVNALFRSLKLENFRIRSLRMQKKCFREDKLDLTIQEYQRLLAAARRKEDRKTELLIETICSTGIRVGELKFITIEALKATSIQVNLKGKVREILLPTKLIRKLKSYAREQGISAGAVFRSARGNPLSRQQVWAAMKALCNEARVDAEKVFPHNLRHLFARCFYENTRDIVKLADVLGHSNLQTTRIYLISTGEEHRREMDRLGLVS